MNYFIRVIFAAVFLCQLAFVSVTYAATSAGATDSAVFKIKIFDVGQGNCIAIRYKDESILIDCGSSSMSFTAKHASRSEVIPRTFNVKRKSTSGGGSSAGAGTAHNAGPEKKAQAKLTDIDENPTRKPKYVSSSESSSGPSSEDDASETREDFRSAVIDEIREFLGDTIKTVIITHPDKDHYNLIPEVTEGLEVQNIILGGQREGYTEAGIIDWLATQTCAKLSTSVPYSSNTPPQRCK